MALDEVVDTIAKALRDLDRRQRDGNEDVRVLRARIDALIEVLIAKDVLTAQHRKHFDRCARNGADEPRRIRLNQFPDKYDMTHGEPVDCADRIPICKARCCKFTVVLSEQDLDEGQLKWDLDRPYELRRAGDGRCIYQDRQTGFCGNYEHRPAPCRWYSCKDDKRIWLDFENKIIAPPAMTIGDDDLQPA